MIIKTGRGTISWGPREWGYSDDPPRVIEAGDLVTCELMPTYAGIETQQQVQVVMGLSSWRLRPTRSRRPACPWPACSVSGDRPDRAVPGQRVRVPLADVPGSGRSTGTWDPVSTKEGHAFYDIIEWVAEQEWSTCRVGMIGESYYCWSQWNAARMRPPHLKAIAAFDGGSDLYRDWLYEGGMPDFGFISSWTAALLLQHQVEGHPITAATGTRAVRSA